MKKTFTKIINWLKNFFLPPEGTKLWLRILPYAILGILTGVLISGTNVVWTYTNSSVFCGTSCHTMPPEYSAYLESPHARVNCVECHIGRDVLTTQFTRKAGDLRHVILNLTGAYEYPIRSHQMRPARDACETCHFPEKFSDDSLREIKSYGFDENNTSKNIFLIMKTGGGTEREGLGFGIHWHIENEVYYYSDDPLEQEIPYVRVVDDNGEITEYIDISSDFSTEEVEGKYLNQIDCITCHNRITHEVPKPEDAVSQAIDKGLIAPDLPFIVEQSVILLREEYPDRETAIVEMQNLHDYYLENYTSLYANREADIRQAVSVLQDIYLQNVFPDQLAGWDTHPNNLGHVDDPGCFRCHDGKHINYSGEVIRLECNLCHSIPVVSGEGEFTTNIELISGPEPPSHTHTSWIALHGQAYNSTCKSCHEVSEEIANAKVLTEKPAADDTFCGNEACHGSVWTYAGFGANELQPLLEDELFHLLNISPYLIFENPTFENTFSELFNGRCTACHNSSDLFAGLDLSSYETTLLGGKNGPGIIAGDPGSSLVFIKQNDPDGHFSQLLNDEIDALEAWIEAGAPV